MHISDVTSNNNNQQLVYDTKKNCVVGLHCSHCLVLPEL